MAIKILTPAEIDGMRVVGKLAAETLLHVADRLEVGMTTQDIDDLVHQHTIASGCTPATLGYRGFPKSVCTSINEVVCHGIPDRTKLRDGDIVNVDVTSIFPAKNGFFGDTSATFYIGGVSALARHVTEVARWSLELGIAAVRPGARLNDIGQAIQVYAEGKGCSVVRDYTGHGIHRVFHDEPSVHHYARLGPSPKLKPGMCFTIEPMINLGDYHVDLLADKWTVVTHDRTLSAQFEHTIVVTETGCEVLTARPRPLRWSEDAPGARLGPLSCFGPGGSSS
jgi:methionyl aminopeptidase